MPPDGDLQAVAVGFLRAVSAGEDRAVDLATTLAVRLLDESGASLALSVLEGGPLSITRAIRLAEQVLRPVSNTSSTSRASGGTK